MGKECDLRQRLGVPEDIRFIYNNEGSIVGMEVRDASIDYTTRGQKFLESESETTD